MYLLIIGVLRKEIKMENVILEKMDCIPVLGPNTNQWWAYSEKYDFYIDPPSSVLEKIKTHSDDVDEQEEYFQEILDENPDWLMDDEHWYENEDI